MVRALCSPYKCLGPYDFHFPPFHMLQQFLEPRTLVETGSSLLKKTSAKFSVRHLNLDENLNFKAIIFQNCTKNPTFKFEHRP